MAACCPVNRSQPVKSECPTCGHIGNLVTEATLHHQIRFPENLSLPVVSFYYCANKNCEVGYFADNGIQFKKPQLRELVHIKAGWLCYCFDISKANYLEALASHQSEDIKNFVIEQTKTGTCACTTRNPSGQCCLADFKRLEKEYASEQH